jgi:hypothetical protein
MDSSGHALRSHSASGLQQRKHRAADRHGQPRRHGHRDHASYGSNDDNTFGGNGGNGGNGGDSTCGGNDDNSGNYDNSVDGDDSTFGGNGGGRAAFHRQRHRCAERTLAYRGRRCGRRRGRILALALYRRRVACCQGCSIRRSEWCARLHR